jgi:hypothetical protein
MLAAKAWVPRRAGKQLSAEFVSSNGRLSGTNLFNSRRSAAAYTRRRANGRKAPNQVARPRALEDGEPAHSDLVNTYAQLSHRR